MPNRVSSSLTEAITLQLQVRYTNEAVNWVVSPEVNFEEIVCHGAVI